MNDEELVLSERTAVANLIYMLDTCILFEREDDEAYRKECIDYLVQIYWEFGEEPVAVSTSKMMFAHQDISVRQYASSCLMHAFSWKYVMPNFRGGEFWSELYHNIERAVSMVDIDHLVTRLADGTAALRVVELANEFRSPALAMQLDRAKYANHLIILQDLLKIHVGVVYGEAARAVIEAREYVGRLASDVIIGDAPIFPMKRPVCISVARTQGQTTTSYTQHLINTCFRFRDTPQGLEFWFGVIDKLDEIVPLIDDLDDYANSLDCGRNFCARRQNVLSEFRNGEEPLPDYDDQVDDVGPVVGGIPVPEREDRYPGKLSPLLGE